MSYSILYRSMFLKMSDGRYIPQAEIGDNNVYDISFRGRQRRSRTWENLLYGNAPQQPAYSRQELLDQVRQMIADTVKTYTEDLHRTGEKATEEDVRKNFGYYSAIAVRSTGTHGTTAKMIENFTLSGIEKAITWEELGSIGLELVYYDANNECYTVKIKTELEYLEKWEELHALGHHVYVKYPYMPDHLYESHAKRQPRKPKDLTEGYVVTYSYGSVNYVMPKGTKKHLRLNPRIHDDTVFSSLSAAQKAMSGLWRFHGVSNQKVVKVTRNKSDMTWEIAV